jgi:hypothetical protein
MFPIALISLVFNKDPVQFVMSNNNEVKRLVEDLGNSEDESQSEDIRNEMRESISPYNNSYP